MAASNGGTIPYGKITAEDLNQTPNIEETETKLWRAFNERKPFVYEEALEELKQTHHQQLQKAQHEWLRKEIVKLEGEQKDIERRVVKNGVYMERIREMDTYRTFQTIIDRYQSELDQEVSK